MPNCDPPVPLGPNPLPFLMLVWLYPWPMLGGKGPAPAPPPLPSCPSIEPAATAPCIPEWRLPGTMGEAEAEADAEPCMAGT